MISEIALVKWRRLRIRGECPGSLADASSVGLTSGDGDCPEVGIDPSDAVDNASVGVEIGPSETLTILSDPTDSALASIDDTAASAEVVELDTSLACATGLPGCSDDHGTLTTSLTE